MDLIEKLGLEKCKQIIEVAPDWAESFNVYLVAYGSVGIPCKGDVLITDLRTAIDHHYYGQSEEKELKQYAVLSQEKIEGGAMLVGDNSKVVQMVRDITDNCTDIRNHLSPNTKVIEG